MAVMEYKFIKIDKDSFGNLQAYFSKGSTDWLWKLFFKPTIVHMEESLIGVLYQQSLKSYKNKRAYYPHSRCSDDLYRGFHELISEKKKMGIEIDSREINDY